jgi:hypothetical protein
VTTDPLGDWWQHTVSVARLSGEGAYGDVFDDAVDLLGFVDDSNKLVLNADGEQVVSSARVFFPAATDNVPLQSQVTLPDIFGGRTSQVIATSRHDAGTLATPNHLELALL